LRRTLARLVSSSVKSAESIKHVSDAFLWMKISFINAVAKFASEWAQTFAKYAKESFLSRIDPDPGCRP
jgi:UDP-glucose 6-dehydrogenase